MSIVRGSMATLIARVRGLIGDQAGTVFGDDEIQDALDRVRMAVRYASLLPQPTYGPSTAGVQYLDYYARLSGWEDDVVLSDLSYTDITATATVYEPLVGHWAFATQPAGLGVRVTGKVYDLYAAAADLLEEWAGKLKLNFTFSADMQRFSLSEQVTNVLSVAARYRMQAQPRSVRIIQSESAPQVEGTGITYPADSGGGWT